MFFCIRITTSRSPRRPPQRAPERLRGTPHKIRCVQRHAGRVAFDSQRPFTRHAFDHVVQRDALEDRAQLVIAVRARTKHTEIEIDLAVGADGD